MQQLKAKDSSASPPVEGLSFRTKNSSTSGLAGVKWLRMDKHHVNAWLINTGWTGGAFGQGHRMSLKDQLMGLLRKQRVLEVLVFTWF